MMEGRRIAVRGTVQGVGFRPWVYRLARREGVAGRVHNDANGVTIEAYAGAEVLDDFIRDLRQAPAPACVRAVQWEAIATEAPADFQIAASHAGARPLVSIPADLATCTECLQEVMDPADRRYRYAFTNCTNCGPRFTIVRAMPYDRGTTTMSPFTMCPRCSREYAAVHDRRFHAEPNACPACGPRLRWLDALGGEPALYDPLAAAAAALRNGAIVAIKGIGGFHLACDATADPAVRRLRDRKRREEKPFAVMVRDLAAAHTLARLDAAEAALLTAIERPIVLASRAEGCGLAEAVAPRNPHVGLLLPYTPVHHLLMAEVDRPLVMTSGNVAEEPIACRNGEAVDRLRGIADGFLVHDREIETRCDDSVARVIAGAPVVLRRSRGYVPRPVHLPWACERPVLACGAHLKNTFCLGSERAAYLGPHIGDLESAATLAAFEESVARMERFLGVAPEVIAHDLHPAYLSTHYALRRPETLKIGVQHHHAHVVSAMAEHGLEGPVLGVAYDGTGYGPDGTAWGGELLLVTRPRYERLCTVRPVALAGGDLAIRQVWRIALAVLDDAFAGEPPLSALELFRQVPQRHVRVVRQMVAAQVHAPLAHGVGRYFDAIGALVLRRCESRYEGQIAAEWNGVAEASVRAAGAGASGARCDQYPFMLNSGSTPWEIDLRPMVRSLVADLLAGQAAAAIAVKFHNGLTRATAAAVRSAGRQVGQLPVVLTGGCFQNRLLAEGVRSALEPDFPVYLHHQVPPGDGGIALGQAVIAAALTRRPA